MEILSLPNETTDEVWPQIAPLLEGAMAGLGEKDHDAVVLRFLEGRNFKEVGASLGTSEDGAKKRVGRALEKLRKFFTKRGVMLSAAVLTAAISANSVQGAPAGLAKSVMAAALAKGAAASGSTLTIVKGALRIMAWTKIKTAVVIGVAVIFAAGTTTVVKRRGLPNFGLAIWESSQRYFADEKKKDRDHHDIVLVEELRRSGYINEKTFQWATNQVVSLSTNYANENAPPQFQAPPGDLRTNKIAWITGKAGGTITIMSDGSLN